jgi:hypothetical protein
MVATKRTLRLALLLTALGIASPGSADPDSGGEDKADDLPTHDARKPAEMTDEGFADWRERRSWNRPLVDATIGSGILAGLAGLPVD